MKRNKIPKNLIISFFLHIFIHSKLETKKKKLKKKIKIIDPLMIKKIDNGIKIIELNTLFCNSFLIKYYQNFA